MGGIQNQSSLSFKAYNMFITFLCVVLLLGISGCNKDGMEHTENSWQEEIQLDNGVVIWVDRTVKVERAPDSKWPVGTVGIRGAIRNMDATISVPTTPIAPAPPLWRFNAVPLLLDYDKERNTWVVIAGYFFCNSWEAAGMPAMNKWQYVVKDKQWLMEDVDKKYIGRTPNMYLSFTKAEKFTKVTKEEISKIYWHLPYNDTDKTINPREQRCSLLRNAKTSL